MRILVTGGAGFIGSNIVDAYIELGHDVAVVDKLSTGFERNVNPKARLYKISVRDRELATVFEREKPEIVNHHAAQIDVRKSADDPIADADDNILGSLNVLENCVRSGVRRLIYASSGGAVYGDPDYNPVDENHPVRPISQYGVSKHAVEHYAYLYGLLHGLDYVVLRYANVYGPRQNPRGEAGVVAIFATQMLTGVQPTIFGPGDKTRDYVYVSDVVSSNVLALERGSNLMCNIGTGVETSDQQVFDALAEVLGYKGPPAYAPLRKGEVYRTCLECSLAKRELGWDSRLTFKEGVEMAADYYATLSRSTGAS